MPYIHNLIKKKRNTKNIKLKKKETLKMEELLLFPK